MVYEHSDYRDFLKSALAERARENAGYSLRAFAEKAGVSVSFLSEVLNRKKSLSVELAFKVAVKLNLTDTEAQYLCLQVQLEQEKDPVFREELARRLSALNPSREGFDLSVDLFKLVADWHHYAILELTYVAGFKLEPARVAKRLGITPIEAELAIARLVRLELLKADSSGALRKSKSYVVAQAAVHCDALKKFHRQIMEKAIDSLQTQDPSERMSATDVVPIDSRHLPEVDRLSREFSAAVFKLSERSRVKDSVYALSVHFFNLTKESQS